MLRGAVMRQSVFGEKGFSRFSRTGGNPHYISAQVIGTITKMRMTYPPFEDFAELFRFVRDYNVRRESTNPIHLVARHPVTGSSFEAYIGGEKIFEIEDNISRRRRNILDRPVTIDSEERFAWILYCKLKQKRELITG